MIRWKFVRALLRWAFRGELMVVDAHLRGIRTSLVGTTGKTAGDQTAIDAARASVDDARGIVRKYIG